MGWSSRSAGTALVTVVALVGLAACQAADRTFVVDSLVDAVDAVPGDGVCESTAGGCTVRAAFMEAAALDGVTAVHLEHAQRYELGGAAGDDGGASGDLDVTGSVQLRGNRSVLAATTDRVVDVAPGAILDATDVTLEGSGAAGTWSGEGGGVVRTAGSFLAARVTLTGGVADRGGTVLAAAGGTAQLVTSTVAGNSAGSAGGAVALDGAGSLILASSTVAGNTAPSGAALAGSASQVTVSGSVLGERRDVLGGSQLCALTGAPVSTGGSVAVDASCGLVAAGDEVVRDPWLDPLAEAAPGQWVRRPMAGSPVLEKVAAGCPLQDQLAGTRPLDGDSDGRPVCDAGAVEAQRGLVLSDGANRLGDDPDGIPGIAAPLAQQRWLNIGGTHAMKANGDRYTAGGTGSCGFGCTSELSGGENLDLADEGYVFDVDVTVPSAHPLSIEAFDPAFTYTGDYCQTGAVLNPDSLALTSTAPGGLNPFDVHFATPGSAPARYGDSDHGPAAVRSYCPGDQRLGSGDPATTYLVRAPSSDPTDPLGGPVICHVTFSGRYPTPSTMADWLGAETNPAAPDHHLAPRGLEQEVFGYHYRRWYELCEVPTPELGRYTVQVRTNVDTSWVPAPDRVGDADISDLLGSVAQPVAAGTGGANRYSLRAGFPAAGAAGWDVGVDLGAPHRVAVYTSPAQPDEPFEVPLVELSAADAGRTVDVHLWDVGDIGGVAPDGSPPSADVGLVWPMTSPPLTDCTADRSGGPLPTPATLTGCTVTGLTAPAFNGHLLTISVALPADFTCDEVAVGGCVLRLVTTIHGASNDTVTWSARLR